MTKKHVVIEENLHKIIKEKSKNTGMKIEFIINKILKEAFKEELKE